MLALNCHQLIHLAYITPVLLLETIRLENIFSIYPHIEHYSNNDFKHCFIQTVFCSHNRDIVLSIHFLLPSSPHSLFC